jgi:arylsulfatase
MTNVVIFLADDLGYSDLGCYGGEIKTPNIDSLAGNGIRMSNFHNTPRCSPSRASLLTGLHPHQAGMGILAKDDSAHGGYTGKLNDRCITLAEILKQYGFTTAIRGKWHLTPSNRVPDDAWPTARGFDSFWGTMTGCGTYYQPGTLTRNTENIDHEADGKDFFYTDVIADQSVDFLKSQKSENPEKPYFLYVPFTAPHWPLHAREKTIKEYDGVYDEGWDKLRISRLKRQQELGLLPSYLELSPREPGVLSWEDNPNHEWEVRRMQVYAAMVTEMDQAIGRILDQIRANGDWEDTVILFMSDNGASADPMPLVELQYWRERTDILRQKTKDGRDVRIGNDPLTMPGGEDTYLSYGRGWANLSNTPFRLFKLWAHEGGVASPFIAHWPQGNLHVGEIFDQPFQLTDVMPTLLELLGATYPSDRAGVPLPPLVGQSMFSTWKGSDVANPTLWWEHCGNAAIRSGQWKLVRQYDCPWELYDIDTDRSEITDLSSQHPDIVKDLSEKWEKIAKENGVIPFRQIMNIYDNKNLVMNAYLAIQ